MLKDTYLGYAVSSSAFYNFPVVNRGLKVCVLFFIFLMVGCRKDLLRFRIAERIDTHTATDRLNKIVMINDTLGYCVGGLRFDHSTILKTEDGGRTWDYRNISSAPKALYGLAYFENVIYATGFDGKLLWSADQGAHWQMRQLWYLPYKDLAITGPGSGLLIGGINFYEGYQTFFDTNGFFSAIDSQGYEFNDLEMADARRGYLAGYGLILKTEDGGKSWKTLPIENDNFMAVKDYGRSGVWTCGFNGSIFCSHDAGQSWTRKRNGNDFTKPRYHLLDILFTDALQGYCVGENGLLIYTDDGGEHWMEFEKFTRSTLRSIAVAADGALLVCGDDGALFRLLPKTF